MRRIVKRSLALGLSLMLGVSGILGGVDSVLCSAAVEKSSQKSSASGIDILDYESNTSATEFVVNDIAGMEKLAELVNSGKDSFRGKTVTLTTDLKYDKTVKNNYGIIGNAHNRDGFNGTFDGGFHIIRGINLYSDTIADIGLFGKTESNAKISRIILEDSCIVAQRPDLGLQLGIGGIIGWSNESIINECIVKKDVEITVKGCSIVGGIIGHANDPKIIRCINYGALNASKSVSVGGIIGEIRENGNGKTDAYIKQCINYGTVKISDACYNVGGICGDSFCKKGEGVVECCNIGKVISENCVPFNNLPSFNVGGISNKYLNATNCYNAGYITTDTESYVGGIAGYPSINHFN